MGGKSAGKSWNTSDNNPRYWKKTLCDLWESKVALDLFHGPITFFFFDNLFCVLRVHARGQGANTTSDTAERILGFRRQILRDTVFIKS